MRSRSALALIAVAAVLTARPAAAATSDGIGSLTYDAQYFRTTVRGLQRAEQEKKDGTRTHAKTADGTTSSESTIGSGSSTLQYAAGGLLTLGVVASFIFGSSGNHDFIAPPVVDIPNDNPTVGGNPPGSGDPSTPPNNNVGNPDVGNPDSGNPDVGSTPVTVTPEPDTILMLATGFSGIGALSIRRRRVR